LSYGRKALEPRIAHGPEHTKGVSTKGAESFEGLRPQVTQMDSISVICGLIP